MKNKKGKGVRKPGYKEEKKSIANHTIGTLPDWHPGYDDKGWLFVDEIIIR